jgi:uncharacterized metal-binding protein
MGRGRGLLIGDRAIEANGITAFAYGPGHLMIATEDCTLSMHSLDLKPVKQFKEFTSQPITFIKIVNTPRDFEGIVIIYSTGHDILMCRFEKAFFSGLSVKSKK